MLKIYLDTSALNRIFDDQSQARIYLESSAMITVFAMIEGSRVSLVSSEILLFENSRNPFEDRRVFVSAVLGKARVIQTLGPALLHRAQQIESNCGISGLDALHLACAEKLKADFFITCDDKIIRKYSGSISAVAPTQFALEVMKEKDNE
jgi:predicted nucleic acid-binding protein